ncbi:hypothetical protein CI105_09245 [Candidatus Izimaplasma bacterium ZiA1]|uniref:hypothetical protein n=1 Tax=Candidatus Izimoplasma sp. ZiA1 TaxID=2024899 RepID=UPI000BAA4FA0|nr:hypothetical protein CI105_09245 [Candidatus Izimaplasma bacterium ZiA1]
MANMNLIQLSKLMDLNKEEFLNQYKNEKIKHITKYDGLEVFMICERIFDMNEKVKIYFNFNEQKITSISVARKDAFYLNGKDVYDSFSDFEQHLETVLGKPKKFYGKRYKKFWKTNFCIIRHEIINRFEQQEELVLLPLN